MHFISRCVHGSNVSAALLVRSKPGGSVKASVKIVGPVHAVQPKPGRVTMFFGEEELDFILSEFGQRLVVVEASMTWCRPCKGFERAYEVRACGCRALERL